MKAAIGFGVCVTFPNTPLVGHLVKWLDRLGLEAQPRATRNDAITVLRAGGASEAGIAHCTVDTKIGAVERVEGVGTHLQPHPASVTPWPYVHLLDDRNVVNEDRRLPELAVILRGRSERELPRNGEGRGIEIQAIGVVGIERSTTLARSYISPICLAPSRTRE